MKRANFTESYASVLFQIYGFVSSSLSFSLEYFECVGDSGCSACLKFGCCVLAGAARLKVQISKEIVVYRLVISCEKNGFNLLKSELEAEHQEGRCTYCMMTWICHEAEVPGALVM